MINLGHSVLYDVWILKLNYMCWCRCDMLHNSIEGRYQFAYAMYDSRQFILGGMDEESYIGGAPIVLETDTDTGNLLVKINIAHEMSKQVLENMNPNARKEQEMKERIIKSITFMQQNSLTNNLGSNSN